MKKNIQILGLFALMGLSVFAQTTAVDFNVNDCSGTNRHLFQELDAGKVVVISFVMPCSSCIGPSLSTKSTVQNYATSHPGKVLFYLIDDDGNTSCSSLSSWATNNGMNGVVTIANTAVTETPYGSGGMPKIVVIGGANHKVFFTQNGGVNTTNLSNAINSALLAAAGVAEEKAADVQLTLYPNPVADRLQVSYQLAQGANVQFEVFNMLGSKVKTLPVEKKAAGRNETVLDLESLSTGVYFLKLNMEGGSQVIRFTINR